jgi:hypothetical protein
MTTTRTAGIILGTGAPNLTKNGTRTMCAIVLSEDLGFIRIYPIPAEYKFPVWGKVNLSLVRSDTDNRHESYRVEAFEITGKIEDKEDKRDILNSCILKSGEKDPQKYMNENRSSIALVKLSWGNVTAALEQRTPDIASNDQEYSWCKAQCEQWQKPFLSWKSEQGVQHTTHLLGREIYEGLRHNPTSPWNIFNNLQISNPDFEHWLLMGNMKDRRNVWVGVHLHRLKKPIGGSTPLCFTIRDGKPEGWPYLKQEWANVPFADNQPWLFTTDDMTSTTNRGNTLIHA